MKKHLVRGALNLIGSAVFMVVLSFAAIAALMFMRGGPDIFTETLNRLMGRPSASAQQSKAVVGPAVKAGGGRVQKCMVNGQILYSNVGCPNQRTGRIVMWQEGQPVVAPKTEPEPDGKLQGDAIER